jgi:hypothetical protein
MGMVLLPGKQPQKSKDTKLYTQQKEFVLKLKHLVVFFLILTKQRHKSVDSQSIKLGSQQPSLNSEHAP